ncbi:MAG: M20/M25/M40 family metallo-hydrolase [candidate division WOR-3 bacterium]|nr:MAG: M20/M25/M40 family metallo-hydrolase [candidate division WOR-3 bacterium]
MMKNAALTALAVTTAVLAAPSYLAIVEPGPGQDASSVAETGIRVVEDMGRWCLVLVTEEELGPLGQTFGTRLLDSDPGANTYMLVMPRGGFDIGDLDDRHGSVLATLDCGAIVRTDEAGVFEMNALPVELARIRLEPLEFPELDQGLPALPSVDDSLVRVLADRVEHDSILGTIQRLQDFSSRYSRHESCGAAIEWVRSKLEGYGCDTTFLFPFRFGYAPNAVGIRYGKTNPDLIYGICGHVDNTSDAQPDHCPGADDNASGTAAALEAARVFQDVEFEHTVQFLGFAGEEQGLYGSDSMAQWSRNRGDSILAMLNFDMISYGREDTDTLEVVGKWSNPACEWLVDFFLAQADTFTTLKGKKYMTNYAPYSDHHSYWQRGYVSFCGIEEDFTPEYHTIGDTIGPLYYLWCGTNNVPMATQATKAAVVSLAKLAGAYLPTGVQERPADTRPARLAGVSPSLGPAPVSIRLTAPLGPAGTVEVFDATGRSVAALAQAGKSEVVWEGTDNSGSRVPAGIYLFRVFDRARTQTAKAVLTE